MTESFMDKFKRGAVENKAHANNAYTKAQEGVALSKLGAMDFKNAMNRKKNEDNMYNMPMQTGGTGLFGKDQDHETPRMRIQRMKRNADKHAQLVADTKAYNTSSVEDRRAAFKSLHNQKNSRNLLGTGKKRKSRRRRTRRRKSRRKRTRRKKRTRRRKQRGGCGCSMSGGKRRRKRGGHHELLLLGALGAANMLKSKRKSKRKSRRKSKRKSKRKRR